MKNVESEQRDNTHQPIGGRNPTSERRLMSTHLGGTANTSGWSWATPSGSASCSPRDSTHVWTGLRWAGTRTSHFLRTGRGQSAGGGGRSVFKTYCCKFFYPDIFLGRDTDDSKQATALDTSSDDLLDTIWLSSSWFQLTSLVLEPWYTSVDLAPRLSSVWIRLLNCKLTNRINLMEVLVLEMDVYKVIQCFL